MNYERYMQAVLFGHWAHYRSSIGAPHSRPKKHRAMLNFCLFFDSGNSNGGRPPAASKKRRVIDDDDDDDDDDPPAAAKPRPSPVPAARHAGGSSSGGAGVGGGRPTSGINGYSSSHSGDRQNLEKRKIVAGPPSSGKATGLKARESSSKPASASRKGNDDDDDDDMPLGAILKKHSKAPDASSRNNTVPNKIPSKNGVKSSGSKSFTIPKREGMSPSPRTSSQGAISSGGKKMMGSSSSSSRTTGMGNKRPGSSSSRRDNDDDDDDFEQKPIKLKKRPEDFTRDPHSKSAQKRKLEEQRIKEEAARKKKQRNSQGSSTKVKVKADPGRRTSSASRSRSTGKSQSSRAKPKGRAKPKDQGLRKKTTRADRIEQAMKVYKWWEEPAHEHGIQWHSLEHNGAHFAPEYKPHNVKLKYDGKDVYLTPRQEEVATFYASVSWL